MQLLEISNCGVRAEKRRCFLIAVNGTGLARPARAAVALSPTCGWRRARSRAVAGLGLGWCRAARLPADSCRLSAPLAADAFYQ